MITAVFFDLYGTLAGFRPSRYEIQSEALADFNIEVTPQGIIKGYNLADGFMSAQNATRPLRGLSPTERDAFFSEYERLVLSGAGVEVAPTQAGEIWKRIRQVDYALAAFDDVVPTLQMLREQGLTLGLISNIHQDGDELADTLGLLPHLDFTVTSMEVGSAKPSPPIFLKALDKANSEPAETVHVGDQLTSDIDGAVGVGIVPVLLDRDGNHPDYEEHPRIETLSELPQVLDNLA